MRLIKRIISVLLLVLLCTAASAQEWASKYQTSDAELVLGRTFGDQYKILAYDGLGTMQDGAFAFLIQEENQKCHLVIAESIDGQYRLTVDNTNPKMNHSLPVQLAMNMTVKPEEDGALTRKYELILSYTNEDDTLIKVFAHSAGNSPEWSVDQLVYDLKNSGYIITLTPDRLLVRALDKRNPDHYETWDLSCPGDFTSTDLSSFNPDNLLTYCAEGDYSSYMMKEAYQQELPCDNSDESNLLEEDEYVYCYFSVGDWSFVFCPYTFTEGFVPTRFLAPRLYGDVSQCEVILDGMDDQDRQRYPDDLLESALQTVKDNYADGPGVVLYNIEYYDEWTEMMYKDYGDDPDILEYEADYDAFIAFYVDAEYIDSRYFFGDQITYLFLAHETNGQWEIIDRGS